MAVRHPERMRRLFSPARVLVIAFAGVIALGTGLLLLPATREQGVPTHPVDALFTATSAVCVTGLTVLDTGGDFSILGQVIILLLIQAGGLGIMTFSNLTLLIAGRKIGLAGRMLIEETHSGTLAFNPSHLVLKIMIYTFSFEAVGALLLFIRFSNQFPLSQAAWQSVFHAVSAFCNAGFSLFPDSFMAYEQDILVNLILMTLIVCGGLGFVVFADLFSWYRLIRNRRGYRKLTLHSRVVLRMTGGLILGGAVFLGVLEISGSYEGRSWYETILPSLFLSITARTAGFNTVDTAHLTNATLLGVVILMFIGASPGSTGGGIKTTTFAVLSALVGSNFRNRPQVELLDRSVPPDQVTKALTTLMGLLSALLLGVIFLQITEYGGEAHVDIRSRFLEHLFEVTSALGTVGLSTGVTPTLTSAGKLVIVTCMFLGRLGPLVVAASVIGRRSQIPYQLPKENIMVS